MTTHVMDRLSRGARIGGWLGHPRFPAAAVLAVSAASLAAALFAQYVMGLQPCVLCIWQRWPYVATVVLGAAALAVPGRPQVRAALLTAAMAAFLTGAGIGVFQVGVEQQWWQGTAGCGGISGTGSFEDFQRQLLAAPVVRCDEVQWSLFGLSMAGYNVLLSLALAAFAGAAAWRTVLSRSAR